MAGSKKKLGREGEKMAARALMDAGYEIVCRNYTHPPYELDIIAVKEDTLVVAEVKSFHTPPLGAAEFRIGKRKQRALYNGIDAFLAENSQFSDYNVRIDIFIIDFSTYPADLTHYPGVIFE